MSVLNSPAGRICFVLLMSSTITYGVTHDATAAPQTIMENKPIVILPGQYNFSKTDLRKYQLLALSGDKGAASKVAEYYAFYRSDNQATEFFWAQIGAENGEPDVTKLFAVMLWHREGRDNCTRAVYWARRALGLSNDSTFLNDTRSLLTSIQADKRCKWDSEF